MQVRSRSVPAPVHACVCGLFVLLCCIVFTEQNNHVHVAMKGAVALQFTVLFFLFVVQEGFFVTNIDVV